MSKGSPSENENADDSKILLKITAGKSMTIISPTKQSSYNNESGKRIGKKKSKKKHRKENKNEARKGIILSIKKGMVNVKDKSTKSKRQLEKINGLAKAEYKFGDQKNELKLTIKAYPDLGDTNGKVETYKVLERNDNRSSLKFEKRLSNRTDINSMESRGIDELNPPTSKDLNESKVRNGIVITKDKSGKFLAEQLQSVKSKKRERDNVFDSFNHINDIGIWKVLSSPRTDRPMDVLKLKLSPQKPARIESTLEDCAFNASKYLDIPVSVKTKEEVSGEDSDMLELLPSYDKESDSGNNNINDSGIEVLSSSSCNRSNGNSVRSVAMEENSPTYFHTEDSLLSLDSPFTEGMNRSEHSICHKCGGIIMETNNNTRSPGKCRCSFSDPNSPFEAPVSPIKTNILLPENGKNQDNVSTGQLKSLDFDSDSEKLDTCKVTKTTKHVQSIKTLTKEGVSIHNGSDGEDSDVMIISFDRKEIQTPNTPDKERRSRLRLKLRPSEQSKSPQKLVKETLVSQQKWKGNKSVSPHKFDQSGGTEFTNISNYETENSSDIKPRPVSLDDILDKGLELEHHSGTVAICEEKDNVIEFENDSENSKLNKKGQKNIALSANMTVADTPNLPTVILIDDVNTEDKNVELNKLSSESKTKLKINEEDDHVRKKPLFKNKKLCAIKDVTNSLPLRDSQKGVNEDLTLQNKKPLFKKRTISADGKTENSAKRPCFKAQISMPVTSTIENTEASQFIDKSVEDNVIDLVCDSKQNVHSELCENIKVLSSLPAVTCDDEPVVHFELDKKVDSSSPTENKVVKKEDIKHQRKSSVSKLSTVGLDDEDSLQEFSGTVIEEVVDNCEPVKQAQKPAAVSFDLYQQQFLSFISNTMNSSKQDLSRQSGKPTKSSKEIAEVNDKTHICIDNESTTFNMISNQTTNIEHSTEIESVQPGKIFKKKTDVPLSRASAKFEKATGSANTNKVAIRASKKSIAENEKASTNIRKKPNTRIKSLTVNGTVDQIKNDVLPKVAKSATVNVKVTRQSELVTKNINVTSIKCKSTTVGKCAEIIENNSTTQLQTATCVDATLNNKSDKKTSQEIKQKIDTKSKSLTDKQPADKIESRSTINSENSTTVLIENNQFQGETVRSEVKPVAVQVESDSLSWLTIFGDNAGVENKVKSECGENAKDVMTDLSENLAEINKKMDVSEDEDTNSLDVDDVFCLGNLSSLEPKNEINFSISQERKDRTGKPVENNKISSSGPPYRRRQTAKRTVGKFKSAKRKVESDYEYSNGSSDAETIDLLSIHPESDPDFNPFGDSDDDFVKSAPKRHKSRTCSQVKKTMVMGSECSDTDNESKCSEIDGLDHAESQCSRSRRTKKGRKSCCPCCIGSPRSSLRDHQSEQHVSKDAYKLPRKHKQFVRTTLRLLELQEKIHTLFLTLFPECAEMIKGSNTGTEEFESLIDDVLCGLDNNHSNETWCIPLLQPVPFGKTEACVEQFECPVNNIGMPFIASGSATRTSEIDHANTSGEEKVCSKLVVGKSTVDLNSSSVETAEKKLEIINTNQNDLEAGILWQQTALFNSSSLTSSSSSSSSVMFENNTLADNVDLMEESSTDNVVAHPLVVSESSTCFAQESVVGIDPKTFHHCAHAHVEASNLDSASHMGSESYNNIEYFAPNIDQVPIVQSEITITLDLNAARVSLCRSPKDCLQRLQNQIIKLSKYFLPKLEFKSYFYKNIDNLEFLLDLMNEANSKDNGTISESENEIVEEEMMEKWPRITEDDMAPLIKENDTVQVKVGEREPLFVKCYDLFEQEIKSQRESLKKDICFIEEDKTKETWKSAEDVLNSINSLNQIARRTDMAQRARRPRDSRLRKKRCADEKRTLFVQEKLMNSQNSTFVCNTRTRSGKKAKVGRKRAHPENSKKRFLSGLNLGDKPITEEIECVDEPIHNTTNTQEKSDSSKSCENSVNISSKTEKHSVAEPVVDCSSKLINHGVLEDGDILLKMGGKNIFELMQPS